MNPIYEKLFDTYALAVLRESGGYNEDEINASLERFSLDKSVQLEVDDLFFRYYFRWSADAFSLGLHLGLSLLEEQARRPCFQEKR